MKRLIALLPFPLLFALVLLLAMVSPACANDLTDPEAMKNYFGIAGAVVGAASAIANVTRTDRDDKAVSWLSKVVNFLSLNWFRFVPAHRRK